MDFRCSCGEPVTYKRWEAGYHSCLRCGDRKAQSEIKEKLANVAPLFNKGPLGLLSTSKSVPKVEESVTSYGSSIKVKEKSKIRPKKPVGIVYMDQDPNGQYIYDVDDDKIRKCDRYVIFQV